MWKFISFYTPDYKDEIAVLEDSLIGTPCTYDIEMVKSKGDWKKNAFYKIPFIVKKLKQYKHPLVWVDADAKVVSYPEMFDNMDDALMGGIISPLDGEYVSNTIYLVPSKEVFDFLKEIQKDFFLIGVRPRCMIVIKRNL